MWSKSGVWPIWLGFVKSCLVWNGLATHDDPFKEVDASENLNFVFHSGSHWPAKNHKPLPATGQTGESRLLLQMAQPLLKVRTSTLYMSGDCLPLHSSMLSYGKITKQTKKNSLSEVKNISRLFEWSTFTTGVSACSVCSNSPSGSLLRFLRNCIFTLIKWDTHRLPNTQDDRARSEQDVLQFWFILLCLPVAGVLPCALLKVPLLLRDVVQRANPGRHRSNECFV